MRTAFIVLACLAAACSAPPAPESTSQTKEPVATTSGSVIATIATNDAKVSILSGSKDGEPLRVVVRNSEGTITADGITVEELGRVDPMLGFLVTSAVAHHHTDAPTETKGMYLDATR